MSGGGASSKRRRRGRPAESAIHVLLDYRPARHGRGGIAAYARALAAAYAARYPGDVLSLWAQRFRRAPVRGDDAPPPGARLLAGRLPSRAQEWLARFGVGVDRLAGGADVVHLTDYVPLPVPPGGAALVATVHDVLFEELPECYTPAMRRGLGRVTRFVAARAARIIVPSTRSRDALLVHHGVDPSRVHVIPHGATPLPDAPPARDRGRYVLFVGTLEPRKNLPRLLAAHAMRRDGTRLVVAGPRGWMDEALLDALRGTPGVTWEGEVAPARLAALYRGALALAYPSLGEGFGLPVLEAMAAGRPVLVAVDTACADLAGDAGLAVDGRDVHAIRRALDRLVEDEALAARLGARGRARAAAYTWEEAARRTRRAYLEACAS